MFGKKPEGVEKKKPKRNGLPAWFWMFFGSFMTIMIGVFLYLWQPFKSPVDTDEPQDGMQVNHDNHQPHRQTTDGSENVKKPAATDSHTRKTPQTQKGGYEFYDLLPEQSVTPIPEESITTTQPPKDTENQPADVTLKLPSEKFDDDSTFSSDDTYDGDPAVDVPNMSASTTEKTQQSNGNNQTNSNNQSERDPIEEVIAATETAAKKITKDTINEHKKNSYILQINSYDTAEDADKRRAEVLLAGIDAQVVKKTQQGDTLYQVISETYDSKTAVFLAQERLQSSGIDAFVVERKK